MPKIQRLLGILNNLICIILSIKKVGEITGKETETSEQCMQMESRIKAISEKVASLPKMRILYVAWHDPVKTSGAGIFENEIIEKSGSENIFNDLSGCAQVDQEAIAVRNLEMIMACLGMGTGGQALAMGGNGTRLESDRCLQEWSDLSGKRKSHNPHRPPGSQMAWRCS